jgi:drug/metabolite transporter (DMT)-like permease
LSSGVVAIVLCAALMHALWNALIKGAGDRTVMLGLIALGHVIPGFALALNLPAPDPSSWKFIALSTVIHWGYYYLLNLAYRSGDLSVVYPIARGAAPLLVAVGAWAAIGEALPLLAWIGIGAISGGIFLLARLSRLGHAHKGSILAALGTALTIAAYSVADGIGVRASQEALSYVAWLFTAEIFVAAFVLGTRHRRLRAMAGRTVLIGLAGGVISGGAYALALYAKTIAPIGMVSAMRETSVIFAALFGVIWFGEGPKSQRLVAAAVVTAGIILIGLA